MSMAELKAESKRTLKAVIIVAALFTCIYVGIVGALSLIDHDDGYVEYNFNLKEETSFFGTDDVYHEANDGNKYIVLTFHVYNNHFDRSVPIGPDNWKFDINYNGEIYKNSPVQTHYPKYQSTNVLKGDDTVSIRVFEVPNTLNVDKTDIQLKTYGYGWYAHYNSEIII